MNQVGDQVTLVAFPTPPGSVVYSFVWDFWDGTSTATNDVSVVKTINIGGQPGTDELHYTCRPVAIDGQTVTLVGTITANSPPTILPGVSISTNDDYVPFSTRLQLQAMDIDGDSFVFAWYNGTDYIGAGTTSSAGNVSGTWTGNGTTIVQQYPSSLNYIDAVVTETSTVTCYVVDVRAGTASVDFSLRGFDNPNPLATITAGVGGVSFDSASPPIARVGPDQFVDFTVYVAPLPTHQVEFSWNFSSSNHWSMEPRYESGTRYVLDNGGIQSTVHRDISTEVISSGTSKIATAGVQVTATNIVNGEITRTTTDYTITLIKNTAPSSVEIVRTVNGAIITGDGPITVGAIVEFSAAGTDVDNDVLFYEWRFTQPFAPNPIYFWGPKVLYSTAGYTGTNQAVSGQLTTYDWLGASLVTVLPDTTVESPST